MRVETVRTLALENPIAKLKNPSWAVFVGVLVMSIGLGLLPFIERTWRATGDEPHYLLAAHSLVIDRDFDLANNYDQLDYLAFYFSKDIERQVRPTPGGQQILNHQLGLPVLIAPAYALAGRLGVLLFQVLLGGLLAMVTYRLALVVSGDQVASILATLFVSLSPPLFMYHYLVYPELIGALITTFVLYVAITQDKPTPLVAISILLSLLALPWLNRRFVPLALLLAVLVAWAWRNHQEAGVQDSTSQPRWLHVWRRVGRPTPLGILGFVVTVCSVGLLLWFNSRLGQPERIDIIAPADTSVVWNRLIRGVGWLVDQQRGLFIFGPIYSLALWGVPALIARRNRSWFVLTPFLLSLGVTAAAGGFWVPWELGPRFLVVALPALAPLLALAWRYFRGWKLWVALAGLLFGISLINSWAIIRNPEMPYKSSLPAYYEEKLGFPLTELLPDLAGFARISAAEADPTENQVVTEDGQPLWFAEAGRSLTVTQSGPLHRLPFGHYQLTWPVRVDPGLSAGTEVMRISAKLSGGGPVFNEIITAAELPADGSYGLIEHSFINPNLDRWRTPLILHAVSTGQSNIWGKDMVLAPNPYYALFLPYLYLAILIGGATFTWIWWRRSGREPGPANTISSSSVLVGIKWVLLFLLPLLAFGNLLYQTNQDSRTYDATELFHFVGQLIPDAGANDGRAWIVDPKTNPPQKATHGPFDFYDPGQYQVSFRMKLPEAVETDQTIARLQVNATGNLDELVTQPLRREHFIRPDLYHDFVVSIDNPRRQALSFEVHYLGLAALAIDDITITRVED